MEIGSSQIWLTLAVSYLVERELACTLEKLLARQENVVKITFRETPHDRFPYPFTYFGL